jgi:hypothetical protein
MLMHDDRSGSAIYVYVCARDADLRSWLIDELLLITWLGKVEIRAIDDLHDQRFRGNELDLLLIELDELAPADIELLTTRQWTQPVIGVGEANNPLASSVSVVLDRAPTSMRFKRAIRALLATTAAPSGDRGATKPSNGA